MDDCIVYRPIVDSSDDTALQHDLLAVQEWCAGNGSCHYNVSKTSLISFHRRSNYAPHSYYLNNTAVPSCTSVKYLGIYISHDLSSSNHMSHVTNAANRVLSYLRRNLSLAPSSVKLLAYKTLVLSKFDYGNAIYDPHQANLCNTLESIQNRAARFILSDYS